MIGWFRSQTAARRSCALAMAIDARRDGEDAADILIAADMFESFLAGRSEWTKEHFTDRFARRNIRDRRTIPADGSWAG